MTTYQAARSVHVWWQGLEAASEQPTACTVFQCSVTVNETVPGSYFACCGFNGGYFGVQDHGGGHTRILFSAWDTGSEMNTGRDDPTEIVTGKRVKVLYQAPHVHVQRFGGEGTGAQCFDDKTGWTVGTGIDMCIVHRLCADSKDAMYAAFVNDIHLATYCVPNAGPFGGFYSFVEDFCRDSDSANRCRIATFGPSWLYKSGKNKWIASNKAQFTASAAGKSERGESIWTERPDGIDCKLGTSQGTVILTTGGVSSTDGQQKLKGGPFFFDNHDRAAAPSLPNEDLDSIFLKKSGL